MLDKEIRRYPLFIKLALTIPVITVIFWFVSSYVTSTYLQNTIWQEFQTSNTKILDTLGRQSINDIVYADYFQLRRMLKDSFDRTYMKYLTVYNPDLKPLAIYPEEISSVDFLEIEKIITESAKKELTQKFYSLNDNNLFHIQRTIVSDEGNILGFISMGGYTDQISAVVRKQLWSFVVFGLITLSIQTFLIIFLTLRFTKPLRDATELIKTVENKEPDDLIASVLKVTIPKDASSEVHLFLKVYQRLLRIIEEHQNHRKELAVQATIGRVASHLAHDMRSPLGVIGGYLRDTKDVIDNEDLQSLREAATISVRKLNVMANDLLDYSKAREISPSPTNIKRLFDEIHLELAETAGFYSVALELNALPHLSANLDAHKMNRAFTNIILNSIQSVEKTTGGKVTTTVTAEDSDLKIIIQDTGCGIEPDHLPHIFDSTFTWGKIKGTGLGLSYVKNAIEAHGGSIEVASDRGKGTTFTIELPATLFSEGRFIPGRGEGHMGAAVDKTPATHAQADQHVLVVDDDPGIRTQWRNILKKATGHTPIELSRGEELLKASIDYSKVLTAIVDYQFEESSLNGLDIIEYLKQKKVPKIFLCTGFYEDKDIIKRAKALGVIGIIPKPIPEDLDLKMILDQ